MPYYLTCTFLNNHPFEGIQCKTRSLISGLPCMRRPTLSLQLQPAAALGAWHWANRPRTHFKLRWERRNLIVKVEWENGLEGVQIASACLDTHLYLGLKRLTCDCNKIPASLAERFFLALPGCYLRYVYLFFCWSCSWSPEMVCESCQAGSQHGQAEHFRNRWNILLAP